MKNGGFMKMEKELIKYILELVGEHDFVCEELLNDSNEADYCSTHCQSLNESCIRRLMYQRMFNEKKNNKKYE
jgi:hypothetical protein